MDEPFMAVLRSTIGDIQDSKVASLLCSALYHFTFGVSDANGFVWEIESSLTSAAGYANGLYVGDTPHLYELVASGHEYAYWLHFVVEPPRREDIPTIVELARRISRHPSVRYTKPDEDAARWLESIGVAFPE